MGSRGLELDKDFIIENSSNQVINFIKKGLKKEGEYDKSVNFIHCIWYCITGPRIERSYFLTFSCSSLLLLSFSRKIIMSISFWLFLLNIFSKRFELKNKIKTLEKINNNINHNYIIINNIEIKNKNLEEFNIMKKDLEVKKIEINNLTINLNKVKNFNNDLAKDIYSLRGEIDKFHQKEFSLEEEILNKQEIIEDLHKKNIELKNKLDLMKVQTSNNISKNNNNNNINNVESLFSSKVKVFEIELKEMKNIYKQNLEKI